MKVKTYIPVIRMDFVTRTNLRVISPGIYKQTVVNISVADPGCVTSQDPDPGYTTRIKFPRA